MVCARLYENPAAMGVVCVNLLLKRYAMGGHIGNVVSFPIGVECEPPVAVSVCFGEFDEEAIRTEEHSVNARVSCSEDGVSDVDFPGRCTDERAKVINVCAAQREETERNDREGRSNKISSLHGAWF